MSVKELYFSNKNIINIANIICKTFNIANTDIKKFTSIKKIIITQMNLIYEKNKTKIIKVANIQKCIQKLNNVTYVKVNELLKKNNINIQKLPQKEKINNDTFNSIDDDLNNYAPVGSNSIENGFFKADGSFGNKMMLQNETHETLNDKNTKLHDIQAAYDMLALEYDANPNVINTNMNSLHNIIKKPMKPQEINFALDGGGKKQNEPYINEPQNTFNYDYNPDINEPINTNYNTSNNQSNNQFNNSLINEQTNNQSTNQLNTPQYNQQNTQTMTNPLMNNMSYKNNVKYSGNINERFAQLEADKDINKNIYGLNRVSYSMKRPNNELEERINDKKRELAQKNNLDPEMLMNLSPEQIKQLLLKINKESSDEEENENYKYELLRKIKNQQEQIKKPVKKSAINNTLKKKQLNTQKLTIKSEEWTEPQFYNNYKISLEYTLNNIKKINIIGESEFPLLKPSIDDHHNVFCIVYKNDKLPIVLDPRDDYTLSAIITEMNSALASEEIPIKMQINKNNTITIENTQNENFSLILQENTIGPFLGWQNDIYNNECKYTSEMPHMFLEQSYFMFIKEFSLDTAICEITPDGKVIQLIHNIDKTNINTLTILYKSKNNIDSNFIEFYETPHEITFEFHSEKN